MRVLGCIVAGLILVAALRLGLMVSVVVAGLAFVIALFRDPGRVLASVMAIVLLAAVLSLPPVVRVLTLIMVLLAGA